MECHHLGIRAGPARLEPLDGSHSPPVGLESLAYGQLHYTTRAKRRKTAGLEPAARFAANGGKGIVPSRPEAQMTPKKLYRIGEVMRYSGLSRQTVHNYTMLGLIREAERTDGGHRLYPEDVFDRLGRISELKKTRTLKEIRLLLDGERD